jgi:O-antigen ligase/polysaccharide polymerase Wzy-like membrane protein
MSTVGAIVAALGLVPLLASGELRVRRAGFVAWLVGSVLVAASVLSHVASDARHTAAHRPALAAAGLLAGTLGVAASFWLAERMPWLFLCAVVAAAPVRIPFTVGGSSANVLLPLYVVIAGGALATAYDLVRGRDLPPRLDRIGLALAGFLLWSAISMVWSVDRGRGGVTMLFFYLPFGILIARLGQLREHPRGLRLAFAVQLALAAVFGAVALWQEATHTVFWNPTVEVANTFRPFFRVNSLFWDSSIYARFMAVTLLLLAGLGVFRRLTVPLAAAMVGVFVAMYFAYSQSALLALAVGALVLGAGLWPRRLTVAVAVVAAVVAVGVLTAAVTHHGANRITSDRLHLVRLGERVVQHHPVLGAGLGGFAKAALEGTKHPFRLTGAASHTTPVTVAAEQGPLGVVLYLALLAAVLEAALRAGGQRAVRLTLLAAFIAILTSSLFYNAFFEDPTTWILMALIALVTVRPTPARERPA